MHTKNPNLPIVRLHAVGDGRALARVLVEVLVRRALISEGIIRAGADCEIHDLAG